MPLHLVAISLFASGSATYVGPPVASAPIQTSDLLQSVQRLDTYVNCRTISFTIEHYLGRGVPEPPADFAPSRTSSYLTEISQWSALFDESSYRFETYLDYFLRPNSSRLGKFSVLTWDRTRAITKTWDDLQPKGDAEALRISSVPPFSHYGQGFPAWFGKWIFQLPERISLLDALGNHDVSDPFRGPDGATCWELRLAGYSSLDIIILARRSADGQVQIVSMEMRVIDKDSEPEEMRVRARRRIDFDAFSSDLENPIPSIAVVTTSTYGQEPMWTVQVMNLRSVEAPNSSSEIPSRVFRPSLNDEGMQVADERYQLAYRVGRNQMSIGRRVFETDRPIHGEVGDDLASWMKRGAFIEDKSNSDGPGTSDDSRVGMTWLSAALGIVLLGAAAALLLKPRILTIGRKATCP